MPVSSQLNLATAAFREEDVIAYSLLLLLGLVLTLGTICTVLVLHWIKRRRLQQPLPIPRRKQSETISPSPILFEPPTRWLTIRQNYLAPVQKAFQLKNPRGCTLEEGFNLRDEQRVFLTPPLDGWVLVLGPALVHLSEDPDACFHFMRRLSYKLGLVQFFTADRVVNHHSWALADRGDIVRAYSWAGETVWNQGHVTSAEKKLGLVCFDYGERIPATVVTSSEPVRANVEKVHLLAGQWSIDPTQINAGYSQAEMGLIGEFNLEMHLFS